jgi:hypothetical protein
MALNGSIWGILWLVVEVSKAGDQHFDKGRFDFEHCSLSKVRFK